MVVWGRLFKTAVIIFHMPGELRSLDALEGSPGDSLAPPIRRLRLFCGR